MGNVVIAEACDPKSDASLDALIILASDSANWIDRDARYFLDKIDKLLEADTWGRALMFGPKTWDRFCKEVLGFPADFVERVREGKRILADRGTAAPTVRECRDVLTPSERASDPLPLNPNGVKGADITCSNRTGAPVSRGETADYLTARIARDFPEILERMQAGEFPSVRAAAREAGIVRPTATIYTDAPTAAAKTLLKHFRGERLETLIWALSEGLKGD